MRTPLKFAEKTGFLCGKLSLCECLSQLRRLQLSCSCTFCSQTRAARAAAAPTLNLNLKLRPSRVGRWRRSTFSWPTPTPRDHMYPLNPLSIIRLITFKGEIRPQLIWNHLENWPNDPDKIPVWKVSSTNKIETKGNFCGKWFEWISQMYLSTSSRPQLSLQDAENTDIVFVGHCSRTAFLASCECLRLSVDGNKKFFFLRQQNCTLGSQQPGRGKNP